MISIEEKKEKRKGRRGFLLVTLLLFIILVIVLGLFIFNRAKASEQGDSGKKTDEEDIVFPVNVSLALRGSIADYFEINGEIITQSSVDTFAETQGILSRLYVNLGDKIVRGDLIAEVDPSSAGLTYSLSPVKARVSGTITSLPLSLGDTVNPQRSLATIGDLRQRQVQTFIPEKFLSKIKLDMTAEIRLEAWPDYVIPLKIDEINPVVNPQSRTLEIRMNIPSNEEKILVGMYAEIRLKTEEKDNAVKISSNSILRRLGEVFVFVVEDNQAIKKPIVPGIIFNNIAEIEEGLQEGEKVVYQGQTLIDDGVTVRVIREITIED